MTTPRRRHGNRFELVDGPLSPADPTHEPERRRPLLAVVAVVALLSAALLGLIPTTREGAGPTAGGASIGGAPDNPAATVPAPDCDLDDPATRLSQGIEVQYIPTGSYVITLVARNTTAARPLDVEVQDLILIAHDPRLRPPPS